MKRNATDRKELLKIEDSILKSLSEISDINDMLKDETMIDQLANSKKFASEINQRVAESKITEKEIDLARESNFNYKRFPTSCFQSKPAFLLHS